VALPRLTCHHASAPTSHPKTSFHCALIVFVVFWVSRTVTNAFSNFSRFSMFYAFHCYTPFQFSIFHFHCTFWIVGFEFSSVSISLSPPFLILILSFFLFFFPTTVWRRCLGAVVLQMPDGNEGNGGRKTQRLCFVFPLHMLFFRFFSQHVHCFF